MGDDSDSLYLSSQELHCEFFTVLLYLVRTESSPVHACGCLKGVAAVIIDDESST